MSAIDMYADVGSIIGKHVGSLGLDGIWPMTRDADGCSSRLSHA